MNRKEHLLQIVSEECNEVGQRASKAIRFGLSEVQTGQELNNAQRLIYEFNDLVAVMDMLFQEGHIPYVFDHLMQQKKKAKVEEFLLHSKDQGTLMEYGKKFVQPDFDLKLNKEAFLGTKNKLEPKVDTVSPAY